MGSKRSIEVELEVEVEPDLKMSIFNYFKKTASKAVEEFTHDEIPTMTVREREEVVESLEHLEERGKTRGKYKTWSGDEKKEIGTHAIKRGVVKTIRDLSKKLSRIKETKR